MLRVIDHGRLALVSVDLASLDASSARGVRAAIKPELKPGRVLVLDLAKVEFIDSSGLGALLGVGRELEQAGGELKLCGLQPAVRTLMELVRLHRVFDILESREEALAEAAS